MALLFSCPVSKHEHQADFECLSRFYCIWDSFRAQHPLLSIIDPNAQAEMVRTLVDIYRNLGRHRLLGRVQFCASADCKMQANFQTAEWPSVRASHKVAPTQMS